MKAPRSDCEARATTALPEAQAMVERLTNPPSHAYTYAERLDAVRFIQSQAATIARLQAERDGVREKALRDAAATVLRMMADCNPVHASLGLKTQQEYIADAILALIHEPSDGEGK